MVNDLLRPDGPEQDWITLRPVLDEAMHDLTLVERDALLWRYFEKHAFAEIGLRLGVQENAARMRVERALDKLRAALAKRGVTSVAVVLSELVASRAVGSAPAGLAGRVCRASFVATGTGGIVALIAVWCASLKAKLALGFLTVTAILGLILWNGLTGAASSPPRQARTVSPDNNAGQLSTRTNSSNDLAALGGAPAAAASLPGTEEASLHVRLVARDTGDPLPDVDIRYRYDVGSKISYAQLLSDPRGMVEAVFPNQVTRIEFFVQVDGFAETRLVWRPEHGEVIPAEYAWRLARAVPLGGRVVDATGTPVSGATVEGFCPNDPAAETQRETHIAEFMAQTDDHGRWQNRRAAPELIRSLHLQAGHPENGPSAPVNVSADAAIERELREGTHTLRLTAAEVVSGWVLDPENHPVADASVLLAQPDLCEFKRTSAADGSFLFSGVPIGNHLLCGDAEGFAKTYLRIEGRTNGVRSV